MLYRSRIHPTTALLESLHHVPAPHWARAAYLVTRAGKLAAARDYRIARAAHPGQDVLYCLAGAGTVDMLGERLDVGPGQLVWLANEAPHAHAADARDPWTLLWFRLDGPDPPALRRRLFGDAAPRLALSSAGDLAAWFDRLFAGMRQPAPDLDLRLNLLVAEFLALVEKARAGDTAGKLPAALATLVAAMRECPELPWPASDLAAVTGLGASQTRRLFRRHLRASPRRWLLHERLARAQALLLHRDARLAEVAERCGFCDVNHFTREFKRGLGIAPGAWRRGELGTMSDRWRNSGGT